MQQNSLFVWGERGFYLVCLLIGILWGFPFWGALDFSSFYASGLAASEGDNPYGAHPLTFFVHSAWFTGNNYNLNPPTSLPLFHGLAMLPLDTAFIVWWGLSFTCAAIMLRMLMRDYADRIDATAILWFVSLGAIWDTLHLAQIYLPLAVASTAAWIRLKQDNRSILAGVLIGAVAAIKLNFLVWPVLLFLSGHVRMALAAFATVAVAILLSVGIYGLDVYRQWFEMLAQDGDRAIFPTNGSLTGIFARFGLADIGRAASVALLLAAAAWAFFRRPGAKRASAVALTVSLLASPIAWGHYALFLVPLVLETWHRRGSIEIAVSLLLAVPLVAFVMYPPDLAIGRLTIGSGYFWAFLALLYMAIRLEETEAPKDRPAEEPAASS